MHHAAIKNNVEPIKLLLAAKAEIGITDDEGMTPLHHAAKENSVEALKLLVAAKAPVDMQRSRVSAWQPASALHYAATNNSAKAVQALLALKASAAIKDMVSAAAVVHPMSTECMQLRWQAGRTALDNATLSNSADVAELLQQEQQRATGIDTSPELIRLVCTSPEPEECCTIEAYEHETVLTVLGRVAVNLGLDEEDGKLLQMVFSEHEVPHDSALKVAGLCDQAEFSVLDVDKARTNQRYRQAHARQQAAMYRQRLSLISRMNQRALQASLMHG